MRLTTCRPRTNGNRPCPDDWAPGTLAKVCFSRELPHALKVAALPLPSRRPRLRARQCPATKNVSDRKRKAATATLPRACLPTDGSTSAGAVSKAEQRRQQRQQKPGIVEVMNSRSRNHRKQLLLKRAISGIYLGRYMSSWDPASLGYLASRPRLRVAHEPRDTTGYPRACGNPRSQAMRRHL